ncbi:MAG: hypothetical protein KA100_05355 [Rickettsiales bacterium]|nr:hypothetical protein [Rickettsiales bacterium]
MNSAVAVKEQESLNEVSHEMMQILEILDQIENHTAALRKKLVAELATKSDTINLKLENV